MKKYSLLFAASTMLWLSSCENAKEVKTESPEIETVAPDMSATEEAAEEMDAVADTVKAAVTEEAAEAKTEVKEVMADAKKEMKEAAKLVKEEANKAAQATKEAANSAAEKLEKKAKEAKEAFKK
jgi:uncharacterized coiled-coil DUF342 family protein